MILNFTLKGGLTVPDGTVFSDSGNEFILPCGKILKLWQVVEDYEAGEDLGEVELNNIGVYTDCNFEREMELNDD